MPVVSYLSLAFSSFHMQQAEDKWHDAAPGGGGASTGRQAAMGKGTGGQEV